MTLKYVLKCKAYLKAMIHINTIIDIQSKAILKITFITLLERPIKMWPPL